MNNIIRIPILIVFFIFFMHAADASGKSIIDTKHNLSISGPGTIKAAFEEEICIFCHAPHNARSDVPYLWNRSDSTANYITYKSSTLYSTVGQPSGASKLCLSCHDGTIALGSVLSRYQEILFPGGVRFIPEGASKLGTDLSDDHPVSFPYDSSLALRNPELADPALLPPAVGTDDTGQMQCTSCHNPHNDAYGKFLVMPNAFSSLCTACHRKSGWTLSTHSTSIAAWNGAGVNPWQHTPYSTVSENGCENCHRPHTAGGTERLLNFNFEEDNCIVCHSGNVALTNIVPELTKLSGHAVQNYSGIHDQAEDFVSGAVLKHIECVDCHNPHEVNSDPSPGPPQVSGMVKGVKGIHTSGQQIENAQNLFEICFKCHADNNVLTVVSIDRQIQQLNTRLEFDPANPSYHPVETQGINQNVPSLIPPYTTTSIIFCTDCHGSDNALGPKGPHGSNNKPLLSRRHVTQDFTVESPDSYALCYKCHDRTNILADQSFRRHNTHLTTVQAPCSACHDPHGVSITQGNPLNNSNLINFDVTIVQPDALGRLYFEDLGTFSGRCFLNCHGRAHDETMPY